MEELYKLLETNVLNRAYLARLIYPELTGTSAAKVKLLRQIKARKPFTETELKTVYQVLETLTNQLKSALNQA